MITGYLGTVGGGSSLASGGTITGDLTISGDLIVSGGGAFDFTEEIVSSTDYQQLKITDTDTDNTTQRLGIVGQSYNAEADPLGLLAAFDGASSSFVSLGGTSGDADSNSPMEIRFYTASSHDANGSLIALFKDDKLGIGGDIVPQSLLDVRGPTGTGAASAGVLTLSTKETSVRVGTSDQLGRIDFQAPDESGGSDAILVGASIHAVAEEDFSSTNNSTALVFSTGTTSAPIERMRIDQDGNVGIAENAPAFALVQERV